MASFSCASRHLMPRVGLPCKHLTHNTAVHSSLQLKASSSRCMDSSRSISSLTELLSGRRKKSALNYPPHPGDEVDAQRPLAPDPYDSTYKLPQGAPDARSLSRERFHQFMHGKPQRFSKELKVTVMGCTLAGFGVGVTWLTAYIMRPDDFEWVEEERRRIQEAKERIQQKIERAEKMQNHNA